MFIRSFLLGCLGVYMFHIYEDNSCYISTNILLLPRTLLDDEHERRDHCAASQGGYPGVGDNWHIATQREPGLQFRAAALRKACSHKPLQRFDIAYCRCSCCVRYLGNRLVLSQIILSSSITLRMLGAVLRNQMQLLFQLVASSTSI